MLRRHLSHCLVVLAVLARLTLVAQTNAAQTNAAAAIPAGLQLRLNPMDTLVYRIEEDPVESKQSTVVGVSAVGDIVFPVSRCCAETITISARGRTLEEVKRDLKTELEAKYYAKATIELELKSHSERPGQILMYGAVRNNQFELAPGERRSILDVVLKSMPTEFANLKKVKLLRYDPVTKTMKERIVNVEKIKKGDIKEDVLLQDGDRLDVTESAFSF